MKVSPKLLLGGVAALGGVALLSSSRKKKRGGLVGASGHVIKLPPPPEPPARAPGDPPRAESDEPEAFGPKITISRSIAFNFQPTPGNYDKAHMPKVCIPIVDYCTPELFPPLGFPENFIPADPGVVELASASAMMQVFGVVELRARKDVSPPRGKFELYKHWKKRRDAARNRALAGDKSEFGPVCMKVGYFGIAGESETGDVAVSSVKDDRASAGVGGDNNCTYQVSPSPPRLTVAKKNSARRLVLFVPAHEGGIVLATISAVVRTLR